MLRLVHVLVVAALVFAAADVYKIKFDSTLQAERVAKLRTEVRRERDAIAALRAEWGELENPSRIEALAKRYLHLKPIAPAQFDRFNALPDQPSQLVKPSSSDPIGDVIENLEEPPPTTTGSIWPPAPAPSMEISPAPMGAPARAMAAPAADTGNKTDARAPAVKSGRLDR